MQIVFEERHFNALSNQRAELKEGVPERLEMRELLLELDDTIPHSPFPETRILDYNLHRHWSSEHRTSLWYPHLHNNFKVYEIYLRFGKSRVEIKSFENLIPPPIDEPSELGGFPSHGHLAIGLSNKAFFYQFVIGPRAWLDMNHMQECLLSNLSDSVTLFETISGLESEGYEIWWGEETKHLSDFKAAKDLGSLLNDDNKKGKDWFAIRKECYPESGRLIIKTKNVQNEIERLYPVFNLAALRHLS